MPPRVDEFDPRIEQAEDEIKAIHTQRQNEIKIEKEIKLPIVWRNVAIFTFLHLGALYGLYLCFYAKMPTLIFSLILYVCGGLGITGGAHRLWAHRSYKARLPLRLLLALFQTLALQNSIYEWCRDHRVHHKHSETNADPHNAKRGFVFAHMGWLCMKKHPDVISKGSKLPMDDLIADPVVYWQHRYYKVLAITVCFVLPTIIPMYFWNESFMISYFIPAIMRYVWTLHVTWLVNSAAHMFGMKPYDHRINPAENLFVSFFAIGEGFHNYHHTFPQDYATSEFGAVRLNFTKGFIDTMAFFGLAYDLKKMSPEAVLNRKKRTGDLSEDHPNNHEHNY